jgi:flavin reductase (DIM6/NTAB) family NADH-FMN oxidoreductase RutF
MKKSLGPRTLIHPAPVLVVGTYDADGKPNVMTVSWGGLCCSMPPCVAISLRKATYSYGGLVRRKAFTVSVPSETYAKEVDYFGLVSGQSVDKFAATGLTPVHGETVDAPYVAEFPLALECHLLHTFELGLHTIFVGEILDVKIDPDVLGADGFTDLSKLQPLIYQPDAQAYYRIGEFVGRAFSIGENL